ncbi:MAG: MAPEG family protein [Devosia sp.]
MIAPAYWLIGAGLAQALLALALLFLLGTIRVPMVQRREVRLGDVALSRDPWPEREKKVSNAFDNQFQLPLLFYAGCGLSLYFGTIWIEVAIAWLFVVTRWVHAGIFVTSNHVVRRFTAYTAGYAILSAFWLELLARTFFIAVWNRV